MLFASRLLPGLFLSNNFATKHVAMTNDFNAARGEGGYGAGGEEGAYMEHGQKLVTVFFFISTISGGSFEYC